MDVREQALGLARLEAAPYRFIEAVPDEQRIRARIGRSTRRRNRVERHVATAEQRSKWFKLGYDSGDPTKHDPFRDER